MKKSELMKDMLISLGGSIVFGYFFGFALAVVVFVVCAIVNYRYYLKQNKQ